MDGWIDTGFLYPPRPRSDFVPEVFVELASLKAAGWIV